MTCAKPYIPGLVALRHNPILQVFGARMKEWFDTPSGGGVAMRKLAQLKSTGWRNQEGRLMQISLHGGVKSSVWEPDGCYPPFLSTLFHDLQAIDPGGALRRHTQVNTDNKPKPNIKYVSGSGTGVI